MKYIINFLLSVLVIVVCQAQDTVEKLSYPQINFHANLPVKVDQSASSYSNYMEVQKTMLTAILSGLPITDLQRWNALKLMYDYENSCMIKCVYSGTASLSDHAEKFDFNSELANSYEDKGKLYFSEPITKFDLGFVNKNISELTLPKNLESIQFVPSINTECDNLLPIQCFNSNEYITWLKNSNSTLLLYSQYSFKEDDFVEIPNGITSIADGAMRQSCIDNVLPNRTLIIPNTVKSIGHKSLENCGFSKIIIMSEDEMDISSDSFGDIVPSNFVIYATKKVQKKLKKSVPSLKTNIKSLNKKILNELL